MFEILTRTQSSQSLATNILVLFLILFLPGSGPADDKANVDDQTRLTFHAIPNLPDSIGVAGPVVGVHNDVMVVAGGANFAAADDPELWTKPKRYLDRIWVLERNTIESPSGFHWRNDTDNTRLSSKVAYPAVASTEPGVVVMGGENEDGLTSRAFLLGWSREEKKVVEYDAVIPDLPFPCTAAGAAVVGDFIYLVAGQIESRTGEKGASRFVWRLNIEDVKLSLKTNTVGTPVRWQRVASWPDSAPQRMFPLVTAQHDGFRDRLYVFGGRHFEEGSEQSNLRNLKFLQDGWSFDPSQFDASKLNEETGNYGGPNPWKQLAESPVPLTAGTAISVGPAHVVVPAYATGKILNKFLDLGGEMKDFDHPGFPKTAYAYHTITDTWIPFGTMPANQVTTPAVRWGNEIFLVSGEVRPRVRTADVWRIEVDQKKHSFGTINMTVVVFYLLAMVGIGVYFSFRTKSTDDYFRGGMNVPWWAAGCSIFATMLSSITYMAIPAKAFAQDWVYAIGNLLILAVAPIAVFIALPFFRRIDATSAYEYLELRFNRACRLIGSGSFTLFHVFRMGVVLALASLALASVTPLSPAHCVFVMGGLSIIYCTLGGIEAVIWTDTIQTFILFGGAIACLIIALLGSEPGSMQAAAESGKFHLANFDFGSGSYAIMAIWVVIIGGFGQNVASYTSDQAVVQRYMTTPDQKLAARSIWLNGWMAIPAAVIFFGMGTAFWMFYRSHPEKLDPTIASDRIMPLFISQELPVGLAGLVVAGIFAAAQSTVSTSMNSGATTIVTDFVKPFGFVKSDKACMWLARLVTLCMGILGTLAGLLFVDPDIKSLFDQFISILGLFLGILAGLFALGVTTRRANATGSLIGALVAMIFMITIVLASKNVAIAGFEFRAIFKSIGSEIYQVNGYLYAFIGIVVCYVAGMAASLVTPGPKADLSGLTMWDRAKKP